eukprot:Pgem_evm1s10664
MFMINLLVIVIVSSLNFARLSDAKAMKKVRRDSKCSYSQNSRVADCPSSYTNMGLTCYRGPGTYSSDSRVADCPSGYTNTGASCYRAAHTYSQSSRVADCPSGYTNMGASCYKPPFSSKGMGSMTCKSTEFRSGARCYKKCKSGYTNNGETCGRSARTKSMSSMTCHKDEFRVGA